MSSLQVEGDGRVSFGDLGFGEGAGRIGWFGVVC